MALAIACAGHRAAAPADPLAAAIAARGGALGRVARTSEVDLYVGMPGRWRWRLTLDGGDAMGFALIADGEEQRWTTDGEILTTWLGDAVLLREPLAGSDAESIARFAAVMYLDALGDPRRFGWRPVAAGGDGAPGTAIEAWPVADPAVRYRLGFDRAGRLVAMDGPLALPAIGGGEVSVAFSDFRDVDGFALPFAARYRIGDSPFLDERVVELEVGR